MNTTQLQATIAESERAQRLTAATALTVAVLALTLTVALGAAVDPAAAQNNSSIENKSPYYSNHSGDVDNESWLAGNQDGSKPGPIITMLTRVGTFVIGGNGSGSGAFLTGMLLFGGLLGLVVDAPVGMVGGGVLAVLALFGVVSVGMAPAWLTPVAMFGVALLLSSSARRVLG